MNIHDSRTLVDFQKFTFSGHLRQHVYKVLSENIKLGHADYACYWALELLCSGLVHSLWNTFFETAALHINRASPNVFLYLAEKFEKYAPYESQYSILHMNDMRNNSDVRNLLCEVSASLALCRKNKLPTLPKIKPEHDFSQITITENIKAPSSQYATHLKHKDDPLEIYIPLNELTYCLRPESRDIPKALYWIAWILKYGSVYKKQNKKDLDCNYRPNIFIDEKYKKHIIWILWDCIFDSVKKSPQSGTIQSYIDTLYKFHCLRWTSSLLKSRICFLITAVIFICESKAIDIHTPVPSDIMAVSTLIENIPQWIFAISQTQKTFSS